MNQFQNTRGAAKWILLATILASGMAFFDGSTTSIALPVIQKAFSASITQIQWVVNAYTVMLAALLLISGSLGDKFGRKKIFLLGMALFAGASVLSGLSRSINQLIIFQALQGLAAAIMIPQSLAIINASFASNMRGKVIGLWAGLSGAMVALAPFLGGVLVQKLGWPWVYYINLPLALLTFLVTIQFVPESKNPDEQTLDWVGTLLIVAALITLTYGLLEQPIIGWHKVLPTIIIGLILLVVFFYTEIKVRHPLIPFHIFKSRLVLGANLVTLLVYFTLNGLFFFLVLNLQQVQGLSPIQAGLASLPPALLITFFAGPAGNLADKIGPRVQMVAAPLIITLAFLLLLIPGVHANYFTTFLPALIIFGAGMALIIAPLTKSALSVEEKYSGAASGVNNSISRIAALMAVAILGAIVIGKFSTNLQSSMQSTSMPENEKHQIMDQKNKLAGISVPQNFSQAEQSIAKDSINNSFIKSFRLAMLINAALALCAAAVAWFTIKESV